MKKYLRRRHVVLCFWRCVWHSPNSIPHRSSTLLEIKFLLFVGVTVNTCKKFMMTRAKMRTPATADDFGRALAMPKNYTLVNRQRAASRAKKRKAFVRFFPTSFLG
jgi:hypothetical protein